MSKSKASRKVSSRSIIEKRNKKNSVPRQTCNLHRWFNCRNQTLSTTGNNIVIGTSKMKTFASRADELTIIALASATKINWMLSIMTSSTIGKHLNLHSYYYFVIHAIKSQTENKITHLVLSARLMNFWCTSSIRLHFAGRILIS